MRKKIFLEHIETDIENITAEDMPNEILKEIFEMCGREFAIQFLQTQKGCSFTVPSRPFLKCERRLLLKEFDGTTASLRQIARKYGISDRIVRRLLKETTAKGFLPEEGQIGIFDNKGE